VKLRRGGTGGEGGTDGIHTDTDVQLVAQHAERVKNDLDKLVQLVKESPLVVSSNVGRSQVKQQQPQARGQQAQSRTHAQAATETENQYTSNIAIGPDEPVNFTGYNRSDPNQRQRLRAKRSSQDKPNNVGQKLKQQRPSEEGQSKNTTSGSTSGLTQEQKQAQAQKQKQAQAQAQKQAQNPT